MAPTSFVPLSAQEQRRALTALAQALLDVWLGEPFVPADAAAIGQELVRIGFTRPPAIGRTLDVVGRELSACLSEAELREAQSRLMSVLAEVSSGFAAQLGERILGQQETIRAALLIQRDQAERAMRESEARFRAIFEASPLGIAVADMQGRVLSANPALQAIVGATEDELRGRVILAELAHPEDAQTSYRAFMELAEGKRDRYELELRMFTSDGRMVWTQLAMALVRDAQGQPRFAIGVGQDITERKQAEAERIQLLREQAARAEAERAQERLTFLAEVSAQLASSLDYETTLQQVARSVVPRLADWCSLSLVDPDGALRTVGDAYRHTDEQLRNLTMEVLRTGRSRVVPELDGAGPIRSAMIVPLAGQRGVLGTLALIRTVASDRRYGATDLALAEDLARRAALAVENARLYAQAQEAIRTAEDAARVREQFLSVAAHELKTPVTSLRGFAQLTLRALDKDAELDRARLRHALTVVNLQSDKLTRLVAQLLDIPRIQSGRLALQLRTVDIGQLIQDVVTAMQHQSREHTLRVVTLVHVPMRIDALRIEQVLTNLIDNAIKYSPQGGPIDIEAASPDAHHVRISVRDHGPGIPVEHRARIFERFYQADAAQHTAGMGLGLFISREIVELHGGSISAEFPPDGGARFIVTLPTEPAAS